MITDVFTTLLGLMICPSFLLLDPVAAWREGDDGCGGGLLRAACYVLAPHNYVLMCIANRYRSWQKTFQAAAAIQIVADFASCLLLGSLLLDKIREGDDVPTALLVGYSTSAVGFVLLFGPAVASFNLKIACSCDARKHKCSRAAHGVVGLCIALGLCYVVGGFCLLVLKIDIVCLGYTGHFFDELPECKKDATGEKPGGPFFLAIVGLVLPSVYACRWNIASLGWAGGTCVLALLPSNG